MNKIREIVKSSKTAAWLDIRRFFLKTFDKKKSVNFVSDNPVIFDIGSSDGTDTLEWRKIFPKAAIYAFEPEPSSFQQLLKKVKGGNIECHNIAFGEFNGNAKFHVTNDKLPQGASLRKPTGILQTNPQTKFVKTIDVKVVTLEKFLEENSIKAIDILWLDTQGTELEILQNSGNILDTVKIIHTEISLVKLYDGSALYSELKKFLESKNFKVFEEIIYFGISGNVVFIKND